MSRFTGIEVMTISRPNLDPARLWTKPLGIRTAQIIVFAMPGPRA
jgi:hypothetical protein